VPQTTTISQTTLGTRANREVGEMTFATDRLDGSRKPTVARLEDGI